MRNRSLLGSLVFTMVLGFGAGRAGAQAFLADDIIIISKGQRVKEKARTETQLGPTPGAGGSLFRFSPGAPGAMSPPTTPTPPGVLSAAAAG
ncbi:MAG: hypothetical protein IRY99_08130, partial [Isosphaeraceae bacterium]|nr:hypothetical protein [Isosphaeraceae bacterium]